MGYIAGLGGASVDIHSRGSEGAFRLRDSNLGEVHLTAGGVVRNILEVLSLLGQKTELCSAIATDVFGDMLLHNCAEKHIGTSALAILPSSEVATSTYLSIVDETGDMVAAICDGRIYRNLDDAYVAQHLDLLNGASVVVVDANVSLGGLQELAEKCTAPLYLDPVATDLGERARPFLPMCDTVKPNLQELEALTSMQVRNQKQLDEACALLLDAGVSRVWVSMGDRGLYYADAHGERLRGRSHDFDGCINATGAGDATMAVIAWCQAQNMQPEQTMEYALAAGMLAVSSDCSVNPNTSIDALEEIIEEYVR